VRRPAGERLAKSDACNLTGTGGFATIEANRTNAGDVIAGDVFVEKGREILSGTVTSVNVDEGSFRVNGSQGDPDSGCWCASTTPGRHTVQLGAAARKPTRSTAVLTRGSRSTRTTTPTRSPPGIRCASRARPRGPLWTVWT